MKRIENWGVAILVVCCLSGVRTDAAQPTGQFDYQTCYARWSDSELVLGNAHVRRAWKIRDGLLTATELRDVDAGIEWVARPAARPAPCMEGPIVAEKRQVTVTARGGQASPVEAPSLMVEMKAVGATTLHYEFQVFPAARGIRIRFAVDGAPAQKAAVPAPAKPAEAATGVELTTKKVAAPDTSDALEDLELAPQHLRFSQVTLMDQTDNHNELVTHRDWLLMPNEATFQLPGNVFFIENSLNGAGLLFLKEAPLPHARPLKNEWDAQVTASKRRMRLAGQGYPFVLLAYQGGRTGRIEALQTYQRQLRAFDLARDGKFLSNTWGDRSRDARINEAFILKEIEAGARLGVDVVQIDDGWQKGRTANSARGKGVWNGYWAADPDFWQPDPQRFPHGLEPLTKAARDRGMKFGLWFGPDSSNDAGNWARDAARILELHRTASIDYFKIDSVKATSRAAEANLHRFFGRVLKESAGRVVFDLDVTAEIRPGYFGAAGVGPLFVENRYTDFHRYWPHQTLRNLWMLAQYVDPLRLRMELLNNTRNAQLYPDDPLAPSRYRPDCLFAITMFANPLGWFEVSNLPEDYVAGVSGLVRTWKAERGRLFAGRILPIGDAPDGVSWTGLASIGDQRRSGYVLAFRELNASPRWQVDLSMFAPGSYTVEVLAGRGSAGVADGKLSVTIPEPLDYLWVKLQSTSVEPGKQSACELDRTARIAMKYLLYLPKDYAQKPSWPLLLFLHGSGERGDNLELVKKHGPPKLIEAGKEFPFLVVSPQCPKTHWWELKELSVLLDEIVERYQVDPDRICVTGLSMGGFGTWSLAAYQPKRLAAIVPICGGGEIYWAESIAHLPVWGFHGAKDRVVPLERLEKMVEALKKRGGDPQSTVYPEAQHDSWTETYDNPQLYEWLLRQKRAVK